MNITPIIYIMEYVNHTMLLSKTIDILPLFFQHLFYIYIYTHIHVRINFLYACLTRHSIPSLFFLDDIHKNTTTTTTKRLCWGIEWSIIIFYNVSCQCEIWVELGVVCIFNDDRQTSWSNACRLPIQYIDGEEQESIDQSYCLD